MNNCHVLGSNIQWYKLMYINKGNIAKYYNPFAVVDTLIWFIAWYASKDIFNPAYLNNGNYSVYVFMCNSKYFLVIKLPVTKKLNHKIDMLYFKIVQIVFFKILF